MNVKVKIHQSNKNFTRSIALVISCTLRLPRITIGVFALYFLSAMIMRPLPLQFHLYLFGTKALLSLLIEGLLETTACYATVTPRHFHNIFDYDLVCLSYVSYSFWTSTVLWSHRFIKKITPGRFLICTFMAMQCLFPQYGIGWQGPQRQQPILGSPLAGHIH